MAAEPVQPLEIIAANLDDEQVVELLRLHFATMRSTGPVESCHVLDLSEMRVDELSCWTGWDDDVLLGIGALMDLGDAHGEIKSMHTVEAARGRGVGTAILRHIMETATARGMTRLSLETGAGSFFAPARSLYARHGFALCPPFGAYVPDPNSVFMTREIGGDT